MDGCSEGIDEVSCKERIHMAEGIAAGFEDGVKGGRRDGIEDALVTKEQPERTRSILGAHDNLMVADIEDSFMV